MCCGIMIDVVKEAFDVSLNKPFHAGKTDLYLAQCRMAAMVRAKSVRGFRKTALINCFQ